MKFKFKSSEPDFTFNSIMVFLELMNKNVLYSTHQLDKILNKVTELENTSKLQKQVDDFYDEDTKDIPEE